MKSGESTSLFQIVLLSSPAEANERCRRNKNLEKDFKHFCFSSSTWKRYWKHQITKVDFFMPCVNSRK
ncbi:hypothetical protein TNCV_260262 [Trichonephila clavipes]|uniref:Uncharacterized protein n=1 Tax=Trichonephila clavipes TaxID=2585209 RepID=A0A8X6S0U2_TRICX|nr:hypothetical protein TNCV_260262 [Trichonephila clavipes]